MRVLYKSTIVVWEGIVWEGVYSLPCNRDPVINSSRALGEKKKRRRTDTVHTCRPFLLVYNANPGGDFSFADFF